MQDKTKESMMFLYKHDALSGVEKVSIEDLQMSAKYKVTETFKECRKAKKITQVELYKLTGIPQPNITRFESLNSNPTLEMMVKMAAALGMELEINLKEIKNK